MVAEQFLRLKGKLDERDRLEKMKRKISEEREH
jgi:hypothetical protein